MTTTTPTRVPTGTWALDPVHSSVGFAVRHFGISWVRGGVDEFTLALTVSDSGEYSLQGTAEVARLQIADEQQHGHLASPDFFDAQLYPTLSFASEQVALNDDGTLLAPGELTMRGVTRPVEVLGTWTGPIDDPYGAQRVALELSFDIDRTDWGISWNMPMPSGADILGATVRINGNIELVLQ